MKELFVILAVIAVMLLFVAFRYRRQIQTAIQVWRMFRKMREAGKSAGGGQEIGDKASNDNVELVRCASCNSWKPKSEALKFSRGTFYCSSACVNQAMNVR
ncbi:MAG: hypothetical protein IPN69_13770 [Acidobacteria bacterium]|nr:hypothetical protein [Acidobacteriota bacterium]MBK8148198.1 hypothetical protein [Acidobacteriota bacterium]MBK8811784.1 hypothetical protein [Acidobacteriota bacterium]